MPDGETIQIRDATPADVDGIARTHIACWQEAYAGQLPSDYLGGLSQTYDRRREFWGDIASERGPKEALLIVGDEGEIIGFAHVCPSRDKLADEATGEVTAIYLRKAYWGRGIGR
jgi:GNAT superfamily N-acetyltransferase